MKHSLFIILAAGWCLGGCASVPSKWVTGGPEKLAATPKPGKNLQVVTSPDRRFSLLERDEGEQGDFVWHALYLKAGDAYTLLGSFNAVKAVVWAPDSSFVSFHVEKAVAFDQVEESEYQYAPASRLLKMRRIKVTKVAN